MQTTFAVLLLSFSAILVGLLFAALPYLRSPEPDRPAPLWVLSIAIYALSLLIFSSLTVNVEDLSKPKFAISTLANLLFFTASALQAAFFRSLNKARREIPLFKWLPVAAATYAFIFEFARHGTLDDRIIAASAMGLIPLAWQIYELKELKKSDIGANITYLYWVAMLELVCGFARITLSFVNSYSITQFATIPAGHLIFAILQIILTILSFIGVGKFWTERTAILRTQEREESEKVKLLVAEKEKLLLKLMSSNKTSASGALSATVVHEITQPLSALTLNLSGALRSYANEDYAGLRHRILQCKDNADRIGEIVQIIRSIFRSDVSHINHSDLQAVAQSVYSYALTECRDSAIKLELELEEDVVAHANFREVQHIALNLVLNAIQNLQLQKKDEKSIKIRVWKESGKSKLSVSDNGSGIPEDFRASLFSLLETTKQGGMGVGLWLCAQIAERNRGAINYVPNTPCGSVFETAFPLVTKPITLAK